VSIITLPPRLFPPIGYYAAMMGADRAVVDCSMQFDKRKKATHRYSIADTRGVLDLTVPISRPHGPATWAQAMVSPHGEWWHVHRIALESAYGRTPFFEFVFYRFADIFADPRHESPSVIDIVKQADTAVREFLQIPTEVVYGPAPHGAIPLDGDFATPQMPPYWQIRADKLGFIPSLSILDLIFNLGPEATLYLDCLVKDLRQ
jgi:hypothetical protein